MEETFSVRSVPRLYNQDQPLLGDNPETAVRRLGTWCEVAVSLRGMNSGADEHPLLEDVTKQSSEDRY
jgi:hypothetical protein